MTISDVTGIPEFPTNMGHGAAGSAIVATLFGVLPGTLGIIGSTLGIIWFSIQIFESRTFQHWRQNNRMKRQARRLAKLRAQEKLTVAKIDAIEKVRAARVEAREMLKHESAEAAKLIAHEPVDTEKSLRPL